MRSVSDFQIKDSESIFLDCVQAEDSIRLALA